MLLAVAASGFSVNAAQPSSSVVVFDNTAHPSLTGVFGPGCCQVGNEITLGGNARSIARLSWLIDSQGQNLVGGIETRIYANDGDKGGPGTLLWSSGPLTGIAVVGSETVLHIAVPNVPVPETITVTSRIFDATPIALGRVLGGSAMVGNYNRSWIEVSPGLWRQQFGPWGMQVIAVPEPSIVSLIITACALLLGVSRAQARSPRGAKQGRPALP